MYYLFGVISGLLLTYAFLKMKKYLGLIKKKLKYFDVSFTISHINYPHGDSNKSQIVKTKTMVMRVSSYDEGEAKELAKNLIKDDVIVDIENISEIEHV